MNQSSCARLNEYYIYVLALANTKILITLLYFYILVFDLKTKYYLPQGRLLYMRTMCLNSSGSSWFNSL